MLPRHKGPVVGAVAVIGAGVGLAAMLFALADTYVWRPLPYADPDRLVAIGVNTLSGPPGEWSTVTQAELPSLASWRARTDLFEDVAAFEDRGWLRVQLSGRIRPLRAVAVSDNLLEVLGLEPRWAESDSAAAWVSNRAATALSGGELEPGRSAPLLPEGTLRVRSLIPRAFLLPEADRTLPVDVLLIRPDGPVMTKDRTSTRMPSLVARTRPGVAPEVIEAALSATIPAGRRVVVVPLPEAMTARLRGMATGALLASALIILVCWTNVFNIALTRGLYRGPEIATRTALGATPVRIVRLLATEGARVAALGGAGALAVAWVTLSAAVLVVPPQFTTLGVPSITIRVVAFAAVAALVAGVAWGVASLLAWQLGVRRAGRQVVASRDGRTIRVVRFVVVAGQLGAASVLLAGAALLGHSYLNLLSVDAGMDERTETLTVAHDSTVPAAVRRDIVERTLTALERAEGVQAAGVSEGALLSAPPGTWMLWTADGSVPFISESGRAALVDWTYVSRGYFDAIGLQFLAGRPPTQDQPAVVITESLARRYFGGRMPIGELLRGNETAVPIVGVVRDVRSRSLSVAPRPAAYETGSGIGGYYATTYVLRVPDTARTSEWERIVTGMDPTAVVLDAGAVRDRLDRSVRDRTFAALVVGLFALASVLVTALGLAGVVAYTVVKRTRELAIRLALGATGSRVTRLVVRDAVTAAACGVAGGLVASVWLSRGLESLLYDVRPADPGTLLLTAASLVGVVLGAAVLPAIRAARIAPASALRSE